MFAFKGILKKHISILLCICLTFSVFCCVSFAEEDAYVFYAGDTSNTNIPLSIRYGDGRKGIGYGFYSSLYMEFTGSVESGWYELFMDLKSPDASMGVKFYVDGVLATENELIMTGDTSEVVTNNFGRLYLNGGEHTFKLSASGNGGTEFFKWFLKKDTLAVGDVLNRYAGDVSLTNVPASIKYGDGSGSAGYGFYKSLYVEYDNDVENYGWYELGFDFKSPDLPLEVALYFDNVFIKSIYLKNSDDRKQILNNSFGDFFIGDNIDKIRLTALSGDGGTEYFKMTLTYKGKDDGYKPLSFIFDSVTTENENGGIDARFSTYPYNGVVLGTAGSYVDYKINVPKGNYNLSISYGAYDSDGFLGVSVNGEETEKSILSKNDTFIHRADFDRNKYTDLGVFSLKDGENSLKLSCISGKNGENLPFSYSNFKLTRITEPKSYLYSGNDLTSENKISKLADGTVTVKSFLPTYVAGSDVTMLCCIYKNGVIHKLITSEKENLSSADFVTAQFTDIEAEEEEYDYKCKAFFWENTEGLKPVCSEDILQKVYREFYISENGSDDADGSKSAPFATLSRVKNEIAEINSEMTGDIIVNIESGTYKIDETEVFNQNHSGKNGYSVIFRGFGDEKPVFSGGTEISGWEKHNDYIWKAPYDGEADIRNLYINGFAAQRARSKYRYLPTVDYNIEGSGNINDGVGITAVNFPETLSNPEDIELCWQNAWAFQITPVADIERKDGMVYFIMDQPYYNIARSRQFLSTAPGANRRFHIQNAFELLDEPGEFYYNKKEKMIYYYPFKAENLEKCETVTGTCELMFSLKGNSRDEKITNIIFDNISVKYGAWNEASETGMIVDQADKIATEMNSGTGSGGRMIPAQFDVKNADGIEIRNCEFASLGSSAIAMSDGVTNSLVKGNSIHDISGSGIVIGHWDHNPYGNHPNHVNMTQCSDIDIENNMITRVAYEFKGCIGISVYYEKNINILHNYIKDAAYSGITLGWGWGEEGPCENIKVSYNIVENAVMPPVLDGGHIYTLGPLRNSEISYNYFNGTSGEYGAIYPDSGSSYLEIHNNVVEGCDHWFFGGLYETHDITAYDNYSDTEEFFDYGSSDGYEGENSIEAVNLIDISARPKEAEKIIAEAGLDGKYAHLADDYLYPSWRTDFAQNAPNDNFVISDGTWYQAEDFAEGGQGVGYYKLRPKGNNTIYRPGDVIILRQEDDGAYMISDTYPGEWLMYDINIPYDGTYELTIKGSYVPYTENEKPALVNIYLDGEKIVSNGKISITESWGIKLPNTMGEFDMTKGEHKLKIEFVQMGFAFDCFRVVDIHKRDIPPVTSPDYDEGVIVIEK